MNVLENLYDYLKHNDRAEIVGLGTFICKSSSARINESTGRIDPPRKELLFSKEQKDDRNFVAFMAENEFISQDTAYTWIKQYSDSIKEKLDAGKSVELKGIGKLEKGVLGEYSFVQDSSLNLLDDAFTLEGLQNIQTFDVKETSAPIFTRPMEKKEEKIVIPKDAQEKMSEIEKQINEAKQIKEEKRIEENKEQTETRIITHTEAEIKTDVQRPIQIDDSGEKLDVDATPNTDKTQSTIDRAAEFTGDVVVEDIKRVEDEPKYKGDDNGKENDENAAKNTNDALLNEAKEIVKKRSKINGTKSPSKRGNKRKKRWMIFFWIVLCLLLLCAGYVGCHYMGWLKGIAFIKPIEDKLSYYVPIREVKVETPMAEISTVETSTVETSAESIVEVTKSPEQTPYQAQTVAEPTIKTKASVNRKETKKKTTNPVSQTPKQEVKEVEDNSPVAIQDHSKLGFDVVTGYFADKSKAESGARKAKRLGYDGYVITKIKSGKTIYYVSYGSRRSFTEANDLMQTMMNRLGGNYYVISR